MFEIFNVAFDIGYPIWHNFKKASNHLLTGEQKKTYACFLLQMNSHKISNAGRAAVLICPPGVQDDVTRDSA